MGGRRRRQRWLKIEKWMKLLVQKVQVTEEKKEETPKVEDVSHKEETKTEDVLMRLDKYLKVSRLIKRRTLAKEATEADRILLNGSPAKPSKEVKVGDHLTISYGKRVVEVKITSLLDSTKKADASFMYEFIGETTR